MNIRQTIGDYFNARSERLGLMARMFHATGAIRGLKRGLFGQAELRKAVYRCLACENAETCKLWLQDADDSTLPPAFCPNRPDLERLRAQ